MKLKLLKFPNPLLFTICEPLEFNAINIVLLEQVLEEMENVLKKHNAMGLAANQVGCVYRFFIMKPFGSNEILHLINPSYIPENYDQAFLKEGCLSLPGVFEIVKPRLNKIKVKFQDKHGFEQERVFEGLDAVCVQHEIDHLDGLFWVDKLAREDKRRIKRKLP